MKSDKKLDPLMEGYLSYLLEVSRKAPRTVVDVRCTLGRLSEAMAKRRPGVAVWKLSLEDYLRWLEQLRSEKASPSCLNKYISHVRGLLEYAWRSGRSDRNVLDGFRVQDTQERRMPGALSIEEARRLVQSCPKATETERRDRMVVLLLYGCGLRTNELCQVQVEDVDRDRKELFVRQGKGDRQRVVPIPEGVMAELLGYLLDRGGKRGPLLRTVSKRRRLSSKDICEVVTEAAERAGVTWGVTPKTLRHSYATHLMDQGVDLAVISSLMGHRSPAETGVYLHVLQPQPKEAVDRLDRRNEGGQS
ncbi:MAG: tyrosine-type recombinase/integrase [Planctomycetota bacterium]